MITIAIDDELSFAEQTAQLMQKIDPAGTHTAEQDQQMALETIKKIQPDIVWMDVEMPGMSGLEIAARIKELSPQTNIVFVTGYPDFAVDAFNLRASGYVLKPVTEKGLTDEIEHLRNPVAKPSDRLLDVRCFGNFEVFYRGNIVKFSRSISKEAFAYLIDRRGAGCTVGEICSVLWEDRQADSKLKAQCRVIMASLKKDLAAAGADDVLVKMWNIWSVNTDKFHCDYYDFLRNDVNAINSFQGEYMAQYSWAEMTIETLYSMADQSEDVIGTHTI